MPELDPGEVKSQLVQKFGFAPDGGTNHDTYKLMAGGQPLAYVQVTRHSQAIGPKLYSKMARQLTVRARQFYDMIKCTMSNVQYRALIGAPLPEATVVLPDRPAALPPPPGNTDTG